MNNDVISILFDVLILNFYDMNTYKINILLWFST